MKTKPYLRDPTFPCNYGAYINVMPYSLLRKIGKYDTDLKSKNMVLSNYEGKTNMPLGVIQVDVVKGTTLDLPCLL